MSKNISYIRTSESHTLYYVILYSLTFIVFANQFGPKAGPTRGGTTVVINGTNLGARREDIVNVTIDGVKCNDTDNGYIPGIS